VITLKTLTWDNCFSYGEGNSLDFTKESLTQVLGTNGVGKSSIPLILEEVLYNKNSKGVKKSDIANRNINNGYSISLEFSKEQDNYVVEVSRKASAKVKLLKNGEDISSHTATNTYKTLYEILGIDFKTFSQVVYQNTNSSLQFLTATDTNRKKFLIELLNLDNYVELFDLFKNLSKEANDEISRIEGSLDTVEKWLENNKLTPTEVRAPLNLPDEPEKEEEELRSLLTEIKNIHEKNSKISKNNQYKQLLANIDIVELKNSDYTEFLDDSEAKTGLGEAKARKNAALKHKEKMESLGDKCPTCEQQISSEFKETLITKELVEIADAEFKITSLNNSLREIQDHNKEVTRVRNGIEEWQNLYKSISQDLTSELLNETELKDRAISIKSKIEKVRGEIKRISEENQKIAAANAKVEVITEQTKEFEKKLEELSNNIEGKKETFSHLEMLKKAFSTNGLIAYKIENLVKELEELTNEYLAELSSGRFTLAFVVLNDKLNVEITDDGAIVDILALSSGELARVNTSTLLAIRKLMSSISHSRINVLFLDEVINVLEDAGREKLVEVLLKEDLNTYLVSHGWSHPLLSKVEVVKIGNISKLEVE
jgi:DNA repair exonuclease SbcCD ATPase subunit